MEQKRLVELCTKGPTALLLFLAAMPAIAQDADSKDAPAERVQIDALPFIYPKPIKMPAVRFPEVERAQGLEGWVHVQMMVSPEGKPYELEVVSTTGNKAFEQEALRAGSTLQFTPAMLDGRAVDAAVTFPVYFVTHTRNGANRDFVKVYKALRTAVESKDQVAAQTKLKELAPRNIYENAFFGVARYAYAEQWGTESEQIAGLRQAIGGMTTPQYLEQKLFTTALEKLFVLEVRAKDYASALATYQTWIAQKPETPALARLQPIAEKIRAARFDVGTYSVPGQVREGVWSYRLFKTQFRFKVASGRITQIKLYCQNKYVLFPYDPTLKYTVEKGFGECSIIVYGDTDTAFELFQS